jgi:hypothetical protein
MNSRLFLALVGLLLAGAAGAFAQDPQPAAADTAAAATASDPLEADEATSEPELTWDDYKIKAYTIRLYGGVFGGDQYLNLPVKGDRTYLSEGSDLVMGYDGEFLPADEFDYERYDGPIKELEDGTTFGVRIGSYLTDNFHLDLSLAYTATEAVLTMVDTEDEDNFVREEIDRDASVQVVRGGLEMMYDFDRFELLGFHPYMGFGFGGVISRFSNLEDVSGLYLMGTAGIEHALAGNSSAFVQFNLTTFAMDRHELHYTETVTFTDITAGISFFFDVVPADIRAMHEAEQAEAAAAR